MIAGTTLPQGIANFTRMASAAAVAAMLCLGVACEASAQSPTGASAFNDIELTSSVMWQTMGPGKGYLYPPGIPAVLQRGETHRTFRIEQYFSQVVTGDVLQPHVRGTWADSDDAVLVFNASTQTWSNPYVSVTKPVCDTSAGTYGYRCATDLTFSPSTPTGTVGVSLGLLVGDIEYTHPNSIFWLILPEEARSLPALPTARSSVPDVLQSADYRSFMSAVNADSVRKNVVRITLDGNVSLGSGFISRTIEPLAKLFKPEVMDAANMISDPKVFIITAAHLFPVAYGDGADPLASGVIEAEAQPFRLGYIYDLDVNGKYLPESALLLARNVESDIALLQIRKDSLAQVADALGVASADAIGGLPFADAVAGVHDQVGPLEMVFGYPAIAAGAQVQHVGRLAVNEYPTDDTSNFGPIGKLKLVASESESTLALPGMSGGPVVDRLGRVIGLAVERPNDSNSLIALDFTTVAALPLKGGYALDEKKCLLRFNPFDRILSLVRRDPDCNYGRFGSALNFSPLEGEWTVQEILGFDEGDSGRGSLQNTNGHSVINGQAVINGLTIINGISILEKTVLVVNRDNLDSVNAQIKVDSQGNRFKLNPDAFRSFEPRGVRILDRHSSAESVTGTPLGTLILGTRNAANDDAYRPIYSIRDFAIWLHQEASGPQPFTQLLCLSGAACS